MPTAKECERLFAGKMPEYQPSQKERRIMIVLPIVFWVVLTILCYIL